MQNRTTVNNKFAAVVFPFPTHSNVMETYLLEDDDPVLSVSVRCDVEHVPLVSRHDRVFHQGVPSCVQVVSSDPPHR